MPNYEPPSPLAYESSQDRSHTTTRREVATLACKVLAVWFLADAATGAVGIVIMIAVAIGSAFGSSGSSFGYRLNEAAVLGLVPLAQLLVGLFLWFRASRLAVRMVSDDPAPVTRSDITARDVLAIACMTIGIYTVIPLVRGLARNIMEMLRGQYGIGEWVSSSITWSLLFGFVISVWLILGSRGIVRVLLRARSAAAKRGGERETN